MRSIPLLVAALAIGVASKCWRKTPGPQQWPRGPASLKDCNCHAFEPRQIDAPRKRGGPGKHGNRTQNFPNSQSRQEPSTVSPWLIGLPVLRGKRQDEHEDLLGDGPKSVGSIEDVPIREKRQLHEPNADPADVSETFKNPELSARGPVHDPEDPNAGAEHPHDAVLREDQLAGTRVPGHGLAPEDESLKLAHTGMPRGAFAPEEKSLKLAGTRVPGHGFVGDDLLEKRAGTRVPGHGFVGDDLLEKRAGTRVPGHGFVGDDLLDKRPPKVGVPNDRFFHRTTLVFDRPHRTTHNAHNARPWEWSLPTARPNVNGVCNRYRRKITCHSTTPSLRAMQSLVLYDKYYKEVYQVGSCSKNLTVGISCDGKDSYYTVLDKPDIEFAFFSCALEADLNCPA